ncbi:nitroreductase family protein [Yoonia sp. 208BN28-4]|uniref:nitroreductase family protein n=1 Tax=Yoonia sp. 208BN28-4 TaxID=3126505 RepID=UPI0030B5B946
MTTSQQVLFAALAARFSDAPKATRSEPKIDNLAAMAARGSCRAFTDTPVPNELIKVLCATAMAAPTKSDLQQRDIILLKNPVIRAKLADLVDSQAWVADVPMIAVFCGNNRRQRLLHTHKDVPFANDHLDAFFNAVGDAAIALGTFVTAAEAVGLGTCPISAVRNNARAVADLLELPDHVFPFAGLAFGYPADTPVISKRLPLRVTCHTDRYTEENLMDDIIAYDADRMQSQPYANIRLQDVFGESDVYGWSDDKVRQYSQPERADFGHYIRSIGFKLD